MRLETVLQLLYVVSTLYMFYRAGKGTVIKTYTRNETLLNAAIYMIILVAMLIYWGWSF